MKPIYLFLADGSEEMEALAVVDILRRAGLSVRIVSVTGNLMVRGSHDILIQADEVFEEANLDKASMFILPGGLPGAYNLYEHEGLRNAIQKQYNAGGLLAAICAAPLVYGRMGLLKERKATVYPGFEEELEGATCTGNLVTCDGQFVTGKGPAAVFEFAYTIAALFVGEEQVVALKKGMLYTELVL